MSMMIISPSFTPDRQTIAFYSKLTPNRFKWVEFWVNCFVVLVSFVILKCGIKSFFFPWKHGKPTTPKYVRHTSSSAARRIPRRTAPASSASAASSSSSSMVDDDELAEAKSESEDDEDFFFDRHSDNESLFRVYWQGRALPLVTLNAFGEFLKHDLAQIRGLLFFSNRNLAPTTQKMRLLRENLIVELNKLDRRHFKAVSITDLEIQKGTRKQMGKMAVVLPQWIEKQQAQNQKVWIFV
jgi:hypothetical protein